jgi:hypothetical protein
LPYFIASKWEAHKGRGNNDFRTSKDFEDFVYALENVDDFEAQILNSPDHIRSYLLSEFKDIIDSSDFEEGLYAHLQGGYGGLDASYIQNKLKTALGIKIA